MVHFELATVERPAHRTADRATRCAITALLLLTAGCATTRETGQGTAHDHPAPGASGAATQSLLAVPAAIRTEHEHLHHELDAAIASGGQTGARAGKVAEILLAHFREEEAYAMPPLGLLESLARNEPVDDIRAGLAIQMADRLRHEYDKMLREHHALTVELRKLAAAAKEEAKPDQARFAEELIVHAQNEEQVLYPATLVIGDYLKLRRSSHAGQ